MRITNTTWATLVAVAAVAAIGAHYLQLPILHWIAKPLATLLIVGMALSLGTNQPTYRRWIVIGLMWSTLGDVLLMLPGDYFLYGLVSFLVAHIAYLVAFSRRERLLVSLTPFAIYSLIAVAVLAFLWPTRLPVALVGGIRVHALVDEPTSARGAWSLGLGLALAR